MIERIVGPERIVGVKARAEGVTQITVKMADGTLQEFVPLVPQPEPQGRYIGKHEKLEGGYRHGRTGT